MQSIKSNCFASSLAIKTLLEFADMANSGKM